MDIEEIKKLITHLEESKLRKLVLKQGDFELHLEKEGAAPLAYRRPAAVEPVSESAFHSEVPHKPDRAGARSTELPGAYVTSPMVGTYYASPGPDQPSFVKVGDKVTEGTVVCIIEAMKVLNEVKAGKSGTIAEILVENAQPVEFGSRLFRIV